MDTQKNVKENTHGAFFYANGVYTKEPNKMSYQ